MYVLIKGQKIFLKPKGNKWNFLLKKKRVQNLSQWKEANAKEAENLLIVVDPTHPKAAP